VEDRIRGAKATGLRNLPFDRWRRNAVWLELVLAAQDLVCWTQELLLDRHPALAEPKALRYRLLHVAVRIVRHARRTILRLQATWPWAAALARAFAQLRALPLRCRASTVRVRWLPGNSRAPRHVPIPTPDRDPATDLTPNQPNDLEKFAQRLTGPPAPAQSRRHRPAQPRS
jgi:hypothetical protein